MQKTKTKIITALLLFALTLAVFPLAVNASTGFIIINATTVPSPATSVPAGGSVNLFFGNVLFSGGQLYLLMSLDGFSQVTAGDIRFTPSFSLNALQSGTPSVVTDPTGTFKGTWTIGQNWINGTIAADIAGGPYFVKCFDGATTSVAVTDQPFTVTAAFTVTPTTGAPGTPLTLKGTAFPSGALVNVTYINAFTLPNPTLVTVSNLTVTGSIGNFTLTIPAPDLLQAAPLNDNPAVSNAITFTAQDNKTQTAYTATYNEMERGLLQFGRPSSSGIAGSLQNATGIYGNLTDFSALVSVGVGDSVRIVGNWFYPGNATFRWDNAVDITPSNRAANDTGYFNTTVTVPGTGLGGHNITIVDANNVVFAVFLTVVQSITISPTSGPIGTVVTVNGFGFPAAGVPAGNAYNATITFDTTARGSVLTDANGAFTTTIVVPTASGGPHTITATTNDTLLTSASKPFTVTSAFTVTPSSFYPNSSNTEVKASGTGFDPTQSFFVAIDNQFSPFTNTTNGIIPSSAGNINFSFVGVGFTPGLHIVSVYQAGLGSGLNAPIANATFTVLADPNTDLLSAINSTVVNIHSDLASLQASVTSINGNIATLTTNVGTLTTSVSSLSSSISGISGSLATVTTNLGTLTTSLSSIGAKLDSVSGDTATIKSSVGTLSTSLSSIGTTVTSISGDTATIKTSLGTLSGTVTSISGDTATIKTSLGTMQADISALKTSVSDVQTGVNGVQTGVNGVQSSVGNVQTAVGNLQKDVTSTKSTSESLSPLIIVAIVLALIAAIAAIASIVLMRRKIAG